MQLGKTQSNRAFEEMRKAAVARLQGRQPMDIFRKTGIPFDVEKSSFSVTSLGLSLNVHYPDYNIMPAVNEWQQLVLLHYMDLADGTPLIQQWITMRELKDGMVRGGGFDRSCETKIRLQLSYCSPDLLLRTCRSLRAEIISSNADVCAVFPFLPRYPVMLKIWLADEEIPGSGRILINGSANHYLTIEDAVTIGELILDRLITDCK